MGGVRGKLPPSVGYADISPTRGEISRSLSSNLPKDPETSVQIRPAMLPHPISPLMGEMPDRAEGGKPRHTESSLL
jgi:hypothetical protein